MFPSHCGNLSPPHSGLNGKLEDLPIGGVRLLKEGFQFLLVDPAVPGFGRLGQTNGLDRVDFPFHSPFFSGDLEQVGNDGKLKADGGWADAFQTVVPILSEIGTSECGEESFCERVILPLTDAFAFLGIAFFKAETSFS